ncbi:MAG: hypothetical protein E7Z64_04330 [Thermoplasmata archaeon]|nr:hypothetical protein [Thermoplasmata archaeon]
MSGSTSKITHQSVVEINIGDTKEIQYYWDSANYESFTKGTDTGTSPNEKYVWTTTSTGNEWNPNKTLIIKNGYTGLLTGDPSTLQISVRYDSASANAGKIAIKENIGTSDGLIASGSSEISSAGSNTIKIVSEFVKDGQNLYVKIYVDSISITTTKKLTLTISEQIPVSGSTSKITHQSVVEINIEETDNTSGSEQYVTGPNSYNITLNATGIKANSIHLVNMGDKMSVISGHSVGDHIVSQGSTVSSTTHNDQIIASGTSVASGTFIGIWTTSPAFMLENRGTITVTCGDTTVGCYFVSEGSESVKQCMFRMPEGETTVSVTYDTKHVTVQGDNGTTRISRMINNNQYTDEYFFEGEDVILEPTANTGYVFSSFQVSSGGVSIASKSLGGRTFNSVFTVGSQDVSVTANFVQQEHSITITQATGGTVTASPSTARAGDTVTLAVSTSKGYILKSLTSAQVSGLTKDSRLFTMPDSDVTISVEYEQMTQLSCSLVSSSGLTVIDVTVAAGLGSDLADPTFLIAGTYENDIVINAYSHIKVGTDHTERVALSTYGLQEIFIQLVDGISTDPTGYFCVYTVNAGA